MPVPLVSPGPVTPLVQNVVYALPASPCIITGTNLQKSLIYEGPFSDWSGGYHAGGGHTKCVTGNTTIQAEKVKMTGPYSKGSYSLAVLNSGASNYWRLGESSGLVAVDSIGGANGTISGGVALNTSGAISDGNKAMTFDGTTGKVVTVANVAFPATVTIEVWMKGTGSIGAYEPYFSTRVLSSEAGEILLAGTDTHVLAYSTSAQHDSTKNVRDGQWHHIAWVFNGPAVTVVVYIDSVLDTSGPFNRTAALTTRPAQLGYEAANAGNYWQGSLDEIAIYPRALTAQEIMSHYAAKTKR